jgi:hypothetical protein
MPFRFQVEKPSPYMIEKFYWMSSILKGLFKKVPLYFVLPSDSEASTAHPVLPSVS